MTHAPVPDLTATATRTVPPRGETVTPVEGRPFTQGVTAAGVTDAIALGTAHREALADRNLTVERVVRVKYPNGSVVRLEETARVSADGDRRATTGTVENRTAERLAARYDLVREGRDGEVTHGGSAHRGTTRCSGRRG